MLLLLAASFYFYASWNQLAGPAHRASRPLMDYVIARGMEALRRAALRRKLLLLQPGRQPRPALVYFKYANFFLALAGRTRCTRPAAQASLPVLQRDPADRHLVLHLRGDQLHGGRLPPARCRPSATWPTSCCSSCSSRTWSPGRSSAPATSCRRSAGRKRWNWPRLHLGVQFFLHGPVQEAGHRRPHGPVRRPGLRRPRRTIGTGAVWLAVARLRPADLLRLLRLHRHGLGSAHLLGYKLAQNFNMPYLAANIAEFWRRWHISLSSWLRDYLFIPLGGSRAGPLADLPQPADHHDAGRPVARGAAGPSCCGALHGLLLIVHRLFRASVRRPRWRVAGAKDVDMSAAAIGLTFLSISLLWIFFRLYDAVAAA